MKPKPLSSLNHFTVPFAIGAPPRYVHCETRRCCEATTAVRGAQLRRAHARLGLSLAVAMGSDGIQVGVIRGHALLCPLREAIPDQSPIGVGYVDRARRPPCDRFDLELRPFEWTVDQNRLHPRQGDRRAPVRCLACLAAALTLGPGLGGGVEGVGLADERLARVGVDLLPLADVDRPPRFPLEARVEEP